MDRKGKFWIMSECIDKRAANVVKLLSDKGKKAATAESCTGGLVSAAITSVSGSSEVFEMGVCSYANRIKQDVLGVTAQALENFGAVSEQVAKEMAQGVMERSGSDFGLSTTGIAGPTGGTEEKPVGTVWIGVCSKNSCHAERFLFGTEGCPEGLAEREYIRRQAVCKALELLHTEIEKS